MKNNVLGFIVYFVATVLLSEKVGVLLLAIKENGDRCYYYNGKWNKTDLAIGGAAEAELKAGNTEAAAAKIAEAKEEIKPCPPGIGLTGQHNTDFTDI